MFIAFYVGALLYCAVTLVFLILSSAQAPGSGLSSLPRLAGVLVAAVFWPATLVVLCLVAALSYRGLHALQRARLSGLRPVLFLN